MSDLVVDASVSAVWLMDDEEHPIAEAAYESVETGTAFVPQIWHFEIRNTLLTAARRRRIPRDDIPSYLDLVNGLRIQTDNEPDFDAVMALAVTHNLTFYDALYLELAIRRNAQLATLDSALTRAAEREGLTEAA